ncbi:MAG: carbamoyl phosphate synthase large subunit [Acidiferrobacteraceae bacterium]|nr:carbamoyl phosphate synthase large subunit [Acidiferrobacteraceae bacterium]HJP06347.1 carbamoyl-phosphate synthase large subunit [Arenicellales bacterium]
MPKRSDIHSILVIGAGPIVIGQACEFDYSGVQACKALREEGYRVILVNSNPATIMTDPEFADATYIEPITWEAVALVIEKERPDALLPTMGGQTGLNCSLDLARHGVLEKFAVQMIGATRDAIDKAEDRERFRNAMQDIGLEVVRGDLAHSMEEAMSVLDLIGFPVIIRPSFTLGGSGGGIAYNIEEYAAICKRGLDASPTRELLIEECILGWKEFEMEVVRDSRDNCIIVCSIENFDAMGVHTGDSITVAPALTLTDKEYQIMRNASIAVLREIGVDTGGSNVQFAIDPASGRMVIIEMNPRVSRSSALASKATGFPIAKVAAKLAIGYTLDELDNDITGGATPASFEPSIDYIVTKIPRFDFEKFPQADASLTTQMKSVGEVMAIGRTFKESFQKALRGLEIGSHGLDPLMDPARGEVDLDDLASALRIPGARRAWYIADAFRHGLTLTEVQSLTGIDPWFLAQIFELVVTEGEIGQRKLPDLDQEALWHFKRDGFSDIRLATLLNVSEEQLRARRHELGVRPVYKRVDSCAGEFATPTAYLYSTYEEECEADPEPVDKVVVLGGGPNRIGQGIEFDYCCVHAAMALRQDGYQTIMINCNPETVSTDYDTSDRLYFESLTLEDVLEICAVEKPTGLIVQYGGQTPLKLARGLAKAGVPILGTSPESIHQAEDREHFQELINDLGLLQPPNRTAMAELQALDRAEDIGYPLVVRPSYVLGGRAMEIVHSREELERYLRDAFQVSNESPILLDRFLSDAVEVDVDAVCDGSEVVIGGIMEHIEEAGVHSGDSACVLPPFSLSEETQAELSRQTREMALALNVIGLMNVQFAVKNGDIFVLEVNPRASRTVPFVSKATTRPLAKIGARAMAGQSLARQGVRGTVSPDYFSVKEAVFPFIKFPGVDPVLGPEMKSTGEVMGIGMTFGEAYRKAQRATGTLIPATGSVLISVRTSDQAGVIDVARYLSDSGFSLVATEGTAQALERAGLQARVVNKVSEGRPHVVDSIKNGEFDLIVNTTASRHSRLDSQTIRRQALIHKVTYFTTLAAARAACEAHRSGPDVSVNRLQTLHQTVTV